MVLDLLRILYRWKMSAYLKSVQKKEKRDLHEKFIGKNVSQSQCVSFWSENCIWWKYKFKLNYLCTIKFDKQNGDNFIIKTEIVCVKFHTSRVDQSVKDTFFSKSSFLCRRKIQYIKSALTSPEDFFPNWCLLNFINSFSQKCPYYRNSNFIQIKLLIKVFLWYNINM